MRPNALSLIGLLLLVSLSAIAARPAANFPFSRARKFNALVFPDRSRPDWFLPVNDLRVNETLVNDGGDRFFTFQSSDGTFQLPFELIADVEFTRFVEVVLGDMVRYEVRVVLPAQGVRHGTIDVRVLRGLVQTARWHHLLITQPDKGASLYRILFLAP